MRQYQKLRQYPSRTDQIHCNMRLKNLFQQNISNFLIFKNFKWSTNGKIWFLLKYFVFLLSLNISICLEIAIHVLCKPKTKVVFWDKFYFCWWSKNPLWM